jgi:hypothetical protein
MSFAGMNKRVTYFYRHLACHLDDHHLGVADVAGCAVIAAHAQEQDSYGDPQLPRVVAAAQEEEEAKPEVEEVEEEEVLRKEGEVGGLRVPYY